MGSRPGLGLGARFATAGIPRTGRQPACKACLDATKTRTLPQTVPVKIIDPPLAELARLPTPLTAGEGLVLDYFAEHLGQSWEIYVQPHLN